LATTVFYFLAFVAVIAACAWRFAEEGSRLVLIGRRLDRLEALKADILREYSGLRVHIEALSVADTDKVAALPSTLPADFRDVEVLVNNAGLALGG